MQLLPEQPGLEFKETATSREGAALMRAAVQPERQGLECLERIAAEL